MKKESIVKKNLDLLDEFMKYAFDHPDILDEVPRDASLVILPEGDLSASPHWLDSFFIPNKLAAEQQC